jgi:stage V sporulation protein B
MTTLDTKTPKKKSFAEGAIILGTTAIIVKGMSGIFRIPLANIIGADGIAYYMGVYSIYLLFYTIILMGLPAAITKLVSQYSLAGKDALAKNIAKVGGGLMWGLGLFFFLIMFFGADIIASKINGLEDAGQGIRIIAFALLFVPITASIGAYYNGRQNMRAQAIWQLTDQLVRIISGLTLAIILISISPRMAAFGGNIASVLGCLFALVSILVYVFIISRKKRTNITNEVIEEVAKNEIPTSEILKKIIKIAAPVTISGSIYYLITFFDVFLIPNRLGVAGFSPEASLELYGLFTGFVAPVCALSLAIVNGLSTSLLPAMVKGREDKDRVFVSTQMKLALKTIFILTIPMSMGLFVLAGPLLRLLFPIQETSANNAIFCLCVMSLSIVFVALTTTTTYALTALGRQGVSMIINLVGMVVRIGISYVLVGLPEFNIIGTAIATVLCYALVGILQVVLVKLWLKIDFSILGLVGWPFIFSLIMVVFVLGSYLSFNYFFGDKLGAIISVLVGIIVYLGLLLWTRTIDTADLKAVVSKKLV